METKQCNPDPRAPHGFMRDESLQQGKYVCWCSLWHPPDGVTTLFNKGKDMEKLEIFLLLTTLFGLYLFFGFIVVKLAMVLS